LTKSPLAVGESADSYPSLTSSSSGLGLTNGWKHTRKEENEPIVGFCLLCDQNYYSMEEVEAHHAIGSEACPGYREFLSAAPKFFIHRSNYVVGFEMVD
jgi:hypothetical protein